MGAEAFGAPGMAPGWTLSNKSAVGTAYSAFSTPNALEVDYVGLTELTTVPGISIHFTLFWIEANRWEGLNHAVTMRYAEYAPDLTTGR